ncbi:class I SAM-dependent methyltransferase [Mycolicibacterium sp. P9-64]|uniref:class I SAM-dependent DNA methyltransferase n=1 Tax=Mycolicibacterium sp. P9-64 TaxID=2024612 RepID=UPI0011EFC070|nr:class I SAM-dependent methyltransferase [Mycolicibacterium sp. P9-64]KAA0083612.1 class I SAM-dependent methyltransferase [Mycolicibacterium sp. P9-64]
MDQLGFLEATRDGYDRTAHAYAENFHDYLDDKPVDLAMLSAFAGAVSMGGNKRVVDVGCGTGVTTAKLRSSGIDAFGIDLSPKMIAEAKRLNPGVGFSVGSMTDLEVADQTVGGVCAWYSTIHVPDEHLPRVFDEFHRVLVPGGFALLAFQVGDVHRVFDEAFGERVELTFYRRQPRHVLALLERAGLQPYAELVREPADGTHESTKQAFLISRRAGCPCGSAS